MLRNEIEAYYEVPNDSEEWISDLHLHCLPQLRKKSGRHGNTNAQEMKWS